MDLDDNLPRKQGDALALLTKQDLDPLSVAELEERIAALGRRDRAQPGADDARR